MAQQVKDPVLSLQQLGVATVAEVQSLAQEVLCAMGAAKTYIYVSHYVKKKDYKMADYNYNYPPPRSPLHLVENDWKTF